MSAATLIPWGGLAAVVAVVLRIALDLAQLFVVLTVVVAGALRMDPDLPRQLFFVAHEGVAPAAVGVVEFVLLSLGLVALYAHQSEATGIFGLVGFLVAYVGTVLALLSEVLPRVSEELQGSIVYVLIGLLFYIGWALFGLASLRAQVYPRAAAIVLIIGAVLSAIVVTSLSVTSLSGIIGAVRPWFFLGVAVGLVASLIFAVGIAWLGFSLFRKRSEEVHHPTNAS